MVLGDPKGGRVCGLFCLSLVLLGPGCEHTARRFASVFGPRDAALASKTGSAASPEGQDAGAEGGAEGGAKDLQARQAEARAIWERSIRWISSQEQGFCTIRVQSSFAGQGESMRGVLQRGQSGVQLQLRGRWQGQLVAVELRPIAEGARLETRYGEQTSAVMRVIPKSAYADLWAQLWSKEGGPVAFALALAARAAKVEQGVTPRWSLQRVQESPEGPLLLGRAEPQGELQLQLDSKGQWPVQRKWSMRGEGQAQSRVEDFECRLGASPER